MMPALLCVLCVWTVSCGGAPRWADYPTTVQASDPEAALAVDSDSCQSGVADDPELERVSDFDLFGGQGTALAPGHPIAVRWMKGRSRPYLLSGSRRQKKSILTIAFNDRCDVVVATAVVDPARFDELEVVVLGFIGGETAFRWVEQTLGL